MIISQVKLTEISQEQSLRLDIDYLNYFKSLPKKYYSFNDLFDVVKPTVIELSSLDDDFLYSEIGNVSKEGDVDPNVLNSNDRNMLNEDLFKKIEKGDISSVEKNLILVSKVRPNLKKYVLIDDETKEQYFTTAFIQLKPKKEPGIMYYALRTLLFDSLMAISRQGKGYPTLNEKDLPYLKVDVKVIDELIKNKDKLNELIDKNRIKISSEKKKLVSVNEFIDDSFSKAFNMTSSFRKDIRKGMSYGTQQFKNTLMNTFNVNLSDLSKYKTLRLSARSQNPIFAEIQNKLNNYDLVTLDSIVKEPIHNGESPVYVDDGLIPVIKTQHLSNNGIKEEFDGFVSQEQYDSLPNSKIKKGDLLVCNIGKCSLGKTDINHNDSDYFGASEVMILRINEDKYIPEFVLYYLKSSFGTYQFEREYTGTTNQIHISPEIVGKFVIPHFNKDDQKLVVDIISDEINRQNTINNNISALRKEIEDCVVSIAR